MRSRPIDKEKGAAGFDSVPANREGAGRMLKMGKKKGSYKGPNAAEE